MALELLAKYAAKSQCVSSLSQTLPGELSRVTGLSRPEAGRGNRALVAEGYATMLAHGWYRLAADTRTPEPRNPRNPGTPL